MLSKTSRFVVAVSAAMALLTLGLHHIAFNQGQDPAKIKIAPSVTKRPIPPPTNALLNKLKSGQVTVTMLVDGFDAEDIPKRRQAADAIVELRRHYIAELQRVVKRGYKSKMSKGGQWEDLNALAITRPASPAIAEGAAQNIDFSWMPRIQFGWEHEARFAATALAIRASTASLPALRDQIAASDLPTSRADPAYYNSKAKLSLLCALSILKAATPQWLDGQVNSAKTPEQKNRLQVASQLAKKELDPQKELGSSLLRGFGTAGSLEVTFDPSDLAAMHPDSHKLKWNVVSKNADGKEIVATKEVELSLALIRYGMTQRLTLKNDDRDKNFQPYRPEAQLDGLRVLGCLRAVENQSTWAIWQRLREISLGQSVADNEGEEVGACIRALGQIDIPAARLMLSRIAMEWAPDQQQAATFVLGKIMGRYAVPLLQAEIDKSHAMSQNPNDKWDREIGQGRGKASEGHAQSRRRKAMV